MPNNDCPECSGTGYYGECPTCEGTGTIPKASRGFWGASLRSKSHAWRLSDDGHEYISLCGDLAIKTIYAPGDARKCALCEEEINGSVVRDVRAAVAEVARLLARHDEEADDNAAHLREAEGERDAAVKRAEDAEAIIELWKPIVGLQVLRQGTPMSREEMMRDVTITIVEDSKDGNE